MFNPLNFINKIFKSDNEKQLKRLKNLVIQINNKEQEIRKLIDFCGLDWDPACLNHHKNKKTPIQTVSISQARKPIYSNSVNSNLNYEKYLNKMYSIINV